MLGNTIQKALVVASVALTLPVLGAGAAYADGSDNGHGKGYGKEHSKALSSATPADLHGTRSALDPSGASSDPDGTFQGKGSSTPDQDGKGMDRGADNNDKTGPGTDGNNGCGNEPRLAAPRDGGRPTDDDNNGWCGSKPKPEHTAPAPAKPATVPAAVPATVPANEAPQAPARVAVPQTHAAPVQAVQAPVVTPARPARAAAPAPAAAPRVVANGTVTPLVGSPVAGAAFIGPVVRTGSPAGAAVAAAPTALPFTGAPVGLLLVVAGLTIGAGAALTFAGARRTA